MKGIFQAVIFYKAYRSSPNQVCVKGKTYQIDTGLLDESGRKLKAELTETIESYLTRILRHFKAEINLPVAIDLANCLAAGMESKGLGFFERAQILNAVSEKFSDRWFNFLRQLPEGPVNRILSAKKGVLIEGLSLRAKAGAQKTDLRDLKGLRKSYSTLVDFYYKNQIARNNMAGGFSVLRDELQKICELEAELESSFPTLRVHVAARFIELNNLFVLYPASEVESFLELANIEDSEDRERLREEISFDPRQIDIAQMSIQRQDPDFSGKSASNVRTVLHACLPFQEVVSADVNLGNGCRLHIRPLNSLYHDPIFTITDSSNIQIGGAPTPIKSHRHPSNRNTNHTDTH